MSHVSEIIIVAPQLIHSVTIPVKPVGGGSTAKVIWVLHGLAAS